MTVAEKVSALRPERMLLASGLDKVASGSHRASMRWVGLKILKNKLSEYVRLAAGGETVLITDCDRVVAAYWSAYRPPLLAILFA